MRTARCSSRLLGGDLPGRVPARGVSAQGVSPPCEQNDWQTDVKTLPCRNYVADGNNYREKSTQVLDKVDIFLLIRFILLRFLVGYNVRDFVQSSTNG